LRRFIAGGVLHTPKTEDIKLERKIFKAGSESPIDGEKHEGRGAFSKKKIQGKGFTTGEGGS